MHLWMTTSGKIDLAPSSRPLTPSIEIKKISSTPRPFISSKICIAGIRIVCSFISDIYLLAEMIGKLESIKIIESKDYINSPKDNGYQSLHLILEVPVYLSDGLVYTFLEVQLRTVGMEFWASLEHKIYYKYKGEIPFHLRDELKKTAMVVSELDKNMEALNEKVSDIRLA